MSARHVFLRSLNPMRVVAPQLCVIVGLVLVGLACSETVVAPATVKEVVVSGGGSALRLGQAGQLGVTLKAENGVTLPSVGVTWASSDVSVATVSATGQVTALKRGTATITASAQAASGTASVPVIGVQRVDATPDSVAVIVTQVAQLSAAVTADPGVSVTPTWAVRDTALAAVSATGRVTAKSVVGVTWVVATAEDQRDSVRVRVIPVPVASVTVTPGTSTRIAGQTLQLAAATLDSVGGVLTGRVVTWASSDTGKATVSATGLVTTKIAGPVTISATSEGKVGTASITIAPAVASVAVAPDSLVVIVTQSGSLTATPQSADGAPLVDRTVSWSVLDSAVARVTVDPAQSRVALVTARAVGATTVTATSEGRSRSVRVVVRSVPVARVTVLPATASLSQGRTLQLSAAVTDSVGNALGGRLITWASSDTTVATVTATGLLVARAVGTVRITAASEGQSGTMDVTVLVPVATVSVTPATASLLAGQTVQLTAAVADSAGGALAREIIWSSSNGLVASVSATGLVTATGNGTATLLATSEGVVGTATVTVAGASGSGSGTVRAIEARPSGVAYVSGDTGSVAFRATDANGAAVPPGTGVAYVVGPVTATQTQVTSGALVCAAAGPCRQGLATQGVAAGAAPAVVPLRIVPTAGGTEGRVTVTVVGTVADSLALRFVPASLVAEPTVAVGDTVTVQATLFYAGGSAVPPNARFTLLSGNALLVPCTVGWATVQVPGGCVKLVPSGAGPLVVEARLPKLGGVGSWADTVRFAAGTVPVSRISVSPATAVVNVGSVTALTAELRDDFNNILTGRLVTWSTSDVTVATVSDAGIVTGVKPGEVTVQASSGGKIASATITVLSGFEMRGQSLAVGGSHTCAIAANGKAYCWGDNSDGQLGDGTLLDRIQPAEVTGGRSYRAITAGDRFTCALEEGGAAYCWGATNLLGTGVSARSLVPASVSGGHVFQQLMAGGSHACGLKDSGELWCWGDNFQGQLGVESIQLSLSPVRVPGLVFRSVTAGLIVTCALTKVEAEAYCWGFNGNSELGIGLSGGSYNTPQKVIGGYRFESLTTGGASTCGKTTGGELRCWGGNWAGQTSSDRLNSGFPRVASLYDTGVASVSLGWSTGCGIRADGGVRCWGTNEFGRLGDGGATADFSAAVVPLAGPASLVVVGGAHACALLRSGSMQCWGENYRGQAGDGATTSPREPVRIVQDPGLSRVSAGTEMTCGLIASSGNPTCWGRNLYWNASSRGVLTSPTAVSGILVLSSIATGQTHACGLQSSGDAWCWGPAWSGQLGTGALNYQSGPQRVAGTVPFTTITVGGGHGCGLSATGVAYCWGANSKGQIGDDSPGTDRLAPVPVVTSVTFTRISAGDEFTCGLAADGTAYCWGYNQFGQLGDGTKVNRSVPTQVLGGIKFTSIFGGRNHTCGISTTGRAYCWGMNHTGALGAASVGGEAVVPVEVASTAAFTALSLGLNHTCGLAVGGAAYCWGSNRRYPLGDASLAQEALVAIPNLVKGGESFTSLSAGHEYTCGVSVSGSTFCWGESAAARTTVAVRMPSTVAGGLTFRLGR